MSRENKTSGFFWFSFSPSPDGRIPRPVQNKICLDDPGHYEHHLRHRTYWGPLSKGYYLLLTEEERKILSFILET